MRGDPVQDFLSVESLVPGVCGRRVWGYRLFQQPGSLAAVHQLAQGGHLCMYGEQNAVRAR